MLFIISFALNRLLVPNDFYSFKLVIIIIAKWKGESPFIIYEVSFSEMCVYTPE